MRTREKPKNLQEYKNNRKVKKNNNKYLLTFLLIFLFMMIFTFFMHRYSKISNLQYEIQSLNKELENKQNTKKELYFNLDSLSKSGFIEQVAKEKLNMQYPTQESIVYLNLN